MTDSERIKELLKYLNVSANKLSKELKLATPQVFYDIKAGRCGISKELARKINEKYINVNPVWLLTGAGRMIDDLQAGRIQSLYYLSHGPCRIPRLFI